jgi:predicted RNA-binding protein YlqC (UPF0109 family)
MLELLHYLISKIVETPDDVKIEAKEEGEGSIVFYVEVPEEQRGVIIGKQGMNIKALRNILSIIAKRENKRVYIKIVD